MPREYGWNHEANLRPSWGVGFLLLRKHMSTYRRISRRPERRGRGCLISIVILIWVVLGLLLAYQYYWRPRVSQQIGEQISRQLAGPPTALPGQPAPTAAPGVVPAGVIPTLVAALPTGEIRISEAQANEYLQTNIDRLNPIEQITLRFVPGTIEAALVALSATSTARMGAAIENGQIVATNPAIDGPLSNLVDVQDLIAPLQQQFNEEMNTQGRRVTDVRIEQAELVFVVE
jgi:hypothetical protein